MSTMGISPGGVPSSGYPARQSITPPDTKADEVKGFNVSAKQSKESILIASGDQRFETMFPKDQFELVSGKDLKLPGQASDLLGVKEKKSGKTEFYVGTDPSSNQQAFVVIDYDGKPHKTDKSMAQFSGEANTPGNKLDTTG